MVFAGGDVEVGRMIFEVMDKVIKDGVIIVEEFKFFFIDLEVVEGM